MIKCGGHGFLQFVAPDLALGPSTKSRPTTVTAVWLNKKRRTKGFKLKPNSIIVLSTPVFIKYFEIVC